MADDATCFLSIHFRGLGKESCDFDETSGFMATQLIFVDCFANTLSPTRDHDHLVAALIQPPGGSVSNGREADCTCIEKERKVEFRNSSCHS